MLHCAPCPPRGTAHPRRCCSQLFFVQYWVQYWETPQHCLHGSDPFPYSCVRAAGLCLIATAALCWCRHRRPVEDEAKTSMTPAVKADPDSESGTRKWAAETTSVAVSLQVKAPAQPMPLLSAPPHSVAASKNIQETAPRSKPGRFELEAGWASRRGTGILPSSIRPKR